MLREEANYIGLRDKKEFWKVGHKISNNTVLEYGV